MENVLGIMGGMGPMATNFFYKMIIDKTEAEKDQDHINMIIINNASTPDRTGAILSGDEKAAYESLYSDAKTLESLGCRALCVTCNTAHYFVHQFEDKLSIPVISLIREAAKEMGRRAKGGRVAILATNGTIETGLYQKALIAEGVEPYICSDENRERTMHLIYDCIKAGLPTDREALAEIIKEVEGAGCKGALLACTELPLVKAEVGLSEFYVDPMEIMAERAIEFMGKKVKKA